MSDKTGFLDIVAECDAFESDVDLSYRPREIGAGEFTVLFTKFDMSTAQVKDVDTGIAKATFEIVVGERIGDSFTDTFFFPRGADGASYQQRGLLLLARCAAGRTIKTLTEAVKVLQEGAGDLVLTLSIVASPSKKNAEIYYNVVYQGRVDSDG